MWGGEGRVGGVDRQVKKSVGHITLRDKIVQGISQVIEGDERMARGERGGGEGGGGGGGEGGGGDVFGKNTTVELPRAGVWWGKPR